MRLHQLTIAIVLIILPSLFLHAGELRYSVSPGESVWLSSGNRLACQLSQKIPYFGKALFTSHAGGNFTLSFQLERESVKKRRLAYLRAVAPPWKHKTLPVEIAKTTMKTGNIPAVFGRNAALRTIYELEKGMSPILTFKDWADARDQITISLSAVNLRPALHEFQSCSSTLHPYGFNDLHNLNINFDNDSQQLTGKGKSVLDNIISYLEVDPAVSHIILSGYADKSGDAIYNQELSYMRVDSVQDYLLEKGVPAGLLVTLHDGPRKKNKGIKNQHVHILLQR